MLVSKHDKDRDYDSLLSNMINKIKDLTSQKDDDFLVLAIGETGSGKSMLMLHAFEEYAKEYANIEFVGFTREDFAISLKKALKIPKGYRFVGNDEANVSKRDALSQYNKKLLDLYYSIRGLNVFHWWCNPSVDMIDKPFIKDRVKGMFMITTKCVNMPRTYYFFNQKGLLRILEKYKNLDYKTLNSVKGKYAMYKGWFKDYNGFLKTDYLNKKNPRMIEKVNDFVQDYAKNHDFGDVPFLGFSGNYMTKRFNVPNHFLANLRKRKILKEGVHYFKPAILGQTIKYNAEAVKILDKIMKESLDESYKELLHG